MNPKTRKNALMMTVTVVAIVLIAAGVAAVSMLGKKHETAQAEHATGGSAERGKALMGKYGCAACHVIPGLPEYQLTSPGPPLAGFAERAYVAGVVPNKTENLVKWIMSPQSINPRTAMPRLGVKKAEAQDMAAYLYTLH